MLPVWYTAFWHSSVNGQPVLKPQALIFPHDTAGFDVDDQYYIGDSGLLIKPPTTKGASHVDIYLADDEDYYHHFTSHVYRAPGGRVAVPAPLSDHVPMLQRGGSVVPMRERVRRSAELQRLDPFTLYVAPSHDELSAEGHLYMDDGQTFAYRDDQAFLARKFTLTRDGPGHLRLASTSLTGRDIHTSASSTALQVPGNVYEQETSSVRVERVIVYGLPEVHRIIARDDHGHDTSLAFTYTSGTSRSPSASDASAMLASRLEIRDPRVLIGQDWSILIETAP